MITSLHRSLNVIGARRDLVVVVLLVASIMMMILPLPTWLVDVLLGVNLAASVLLLMMALYLRDPLELSTLPSVILIVTIFRLALSITTTRLILLDADAGQIIETFGEFVIQGSLIVGLVIFLIITIVQFVVITKGSERVAEVSARFTLDALPGKQMSIDSDLRNGDIDQAEARRRRYQIDKESQFFGAMDGAMKFVKGDAIAGLVIIAVNLIGGVSVGMFEKGLDAGEAVGVYSLLTIGDGLAAQLPALFVSLAAGSIITRVATDEAENLGADITRQMMSSTLALRVAATLLFVLMFVPGFPWPVFLFIGLGFIAMSFGEELRVIVYGEEETDDADEASGDRIDTSHSPFIVRVPAGLLTEDDADAFTEGSADATGRFVSEIGLTVLPPRLAVEGGGLTRIRFDLDDVPISQFPLPANVVGVEADNDTLTLARVSAEAVADLPPGFERLSWVDAGQVRTLEDASIPFLRPVDVLLRAADAAQRRNAGQCIGVQEARSVLADMAIEHPDLASEVRDLLPMNKIAEVFRRLVDEGVPSRNRRVLLEALAEWGGKEQDAVVLTEYVRTALKRQICNSIADKDRVIPAYLLDKGVEEAIRGAIRQTTVGEYLALDDIVSSSLVETISDTVRAPNEGGTQAVVLTSLDVRRFVRSLLANNGLRHVPVLSYQDLSAEFTIVPLTTIYLPRMRQAAE